jgi:hypothetical protein
MANLIGDAMPNLQAAMLANFGDRAEYSAGGDPAFFVTVVVSQPRTDELTASKILRIELRESDLPIPPARGHTVTVNDVTYQVLGIDRDIYGWVALTCEVKR